MKRHSLLIVLFLLCTTVGYAQVSYGETVPDIKYPVSGQRKPSSLSNDNVLYTILYFGFIDNPKDGQSILDANPESFALELSDTLKPYFNNFNPDYGRTLMVVSTMKNQKRIEKKLGVTSYPDILLVDPNRRIIARSNKASDIIDYITTNLSMFASTDWNEYILRALKLFESGQVSNAQRIVEDCLTYGRWSNDFSTEAHKAIPLIVASMSREKYSFYVGDIKHRYNIGILSEEDVAPFKNDFKRIHLSSDKVNSFQ